MTGQQPVRYFNVPEDTIYLILGILRLEKDGVKNPASNIDTALEELKECCAGRSDRRQPAPSSKHGINLVKYVKREMTPEQQEVLRKLQCDTGYGDWEIPFDLDEHDAAVAEKARKDEREKVLPLVKTAQNTQLALFRACWDENIIELVKQVGSDLHEIEESLRHHKEGVKK